MMDFIYTTYTAILHNILNLEPTRAHCLLFNTKVQNIKDPTCKINSAAPISTPFAFISRSYWFFRIRGLQPRPFNYIKRPTYILQRIALLGYKIRPPGLKFHTRQTRRIIKLKLDPTPSRPPALSTRAPGLDASATNLVQKACSGILLHQGLCETSGSALGHIW